MGVDPGVNGAAAVVRLDGSVAYVAGLTPDMTHGAAVDVVEAAKDVLLSHGGGLCFAEKVGYIGGGGPPCPACGKRGGGDGGKGANTFGRIDGILRGAVLARPRVVIVDVMPAFWQARMECMTRGNKNVSLRRAKELFPDCFPPKQLKADALRIADALLIAEYGRRWVAAHS